MFVWIKRTEKQFVIADNLLKLNLMDKRNIIDLKDKFFVHQ